MVDYLKLHLRPIPYFLNWSLGYLLRAISFSSHFWKEVSTWHFWHRSWDKAVGASFIKVFSVCDQSIYVNNEPPSYLIFSVLHATSFCDDKRDGLGSEYPKFSSKNEVIKTAPISWYKPRINWYEMQNSNIANQAWKLPSIRSILSTPKLAQNAEYN